MNASFSGLLIALYSHSLRYTMPLLKQNPHDCSHVAQSYRGLSRVSSEQFYSKVFGRKALSLKQIRCRETNSLRVENPTIRHRQAEVPQSP